jgi:hypothetical protein
MYVKLYIGLKVKNRESIILQNYFPLIPPKESILNHKSEQYKIIEKTGSENYKEAEFVHDIHKINYPSLLTRCYIKRKICGKRIIILHIINTM